MNSYNLVQFIEKLLGTKSTSEQNRQSPLGSLHSCGGMLSSVLVEHILWRRNRVERKIWNVFVCNLSRLVKEGHI